MSNIEFTKMHSLGNDFIVIDGVRQAIALHREQITTMATRRFGIGFDQLLLLEPSQRSDADFFYRIFNADGSEVAQCGNGARCVAQFVREHQLSNKDLLTLQTHHGLLKIRQLSDQRVEVDMGSPQLEDQHRTLLIHNQKFRCHLVDVGNPHAVLVLPEEPSNAEIDKIGSALNQHADFPEGINVGFMQIGELADALTLRVYERGSGRTLACGSGAAAAMAVGRRFFDLDDTVTVSQLGGDLVVHWSGEPESNLQLIGPAHTVYQGVWQGNVSGA